MFSRLTYAAGACHRLNAAEEKLYTGAAMRVWRRTTETTFKHCKDRQQNRLGDQEVVEKFDLMAPLTIVRLQRLTFFMRVAAGPNSTLNSVASAARNAQKSWLAAVNDDFVWLRGVDVVCNTSYLQGVDDLKAWVPMVVGNLTHWKRCIKQFCMMRLRIAHNFEIGQDSL